MPSTFEEQGKPCFIHYIFTTVPELTSVTVQTLITHTLFAGRVVVGTWVVCGLSKGSPHVGYQWFRNGSSVGHQWVITRPFSTWLTHDPQASYQRQLNLPCIQIVIWWGFSEREVTTVSFVT